MGFSLKQSMKLSQQLRMTPQLQQAIKMLQLSKLELETAIRKELNENPLLEEMIDTVEGDPGEELKMNTGNKDSDNAKDQDPTKQDEFEWDNYTDQSAPKSQSGQLEAINYDNFISREADLRDHLVWQANMSGFNEEELEQVLTLISYVDDNGYLTHSLEDIAKDSEMEVKELDESLQFIHEFDPAGVGARDLKECLLIQAKHIGEDTHDLTYMIENHLDELQNKNYKLIVEKTNAALKNDIGVEEVQELSEIILSLDPKPGRAFVTSADTQYVTPDVYIKKIGDEYVVSLNEDGLPKLQISQFYRELAHKKAEAEKSVAKSKSPKDKEAAEYLDDKLKAAMWLIKSIHQRQKTIFKVTESIVKHQVEFFEKGPEHIKPMILKDVAHDIEMHESTVSRVTTNKFVYTPRGVFELKYFFNSSISTTGGDSLASESVKMKIKKLVAAEDVKKPLSDQKLVDLLKEDGIKIARRTVAKYRDVLGILPSSKRKKFY
ncbi:MAG: RNA polymerase factor sigma-54 [Bdellovibrionales bacterium]